MSEGQTMCPATMCPYLGLTDGSPWTGDEQTECEDSCGWYQRGHCLAGREHDMDVTDVEGPVPPRELWPSCPYEGECQWEVQREGPCAPRRKLLFGKSINGVML